ncbi:MAG: ABC transporter permease [Clostridia bacterium]|nr:ABC transporter permease [Clostridia bacterium]
MNTMYLAREGLRGRKRDASLLITVVALSFLFITVATIFISSINYTEERNNALLYGSFHAAHFDASQDDVERIRASFADEGDRVAASQSFGECGQFGKVASLTDALEELGAFQMTEGRMPEALGEIALEASQLTALPFGTAVGDTLPFKISFSVFESEVPTSTELNFTAESLREELSELRELSAADIDVGGDGYVEVEFAVTSPFDDSNPMSGEYTDPYYIAIPLAELSEQEFEALVLSTFNARAALSADGWGSHLPSAHRTTTDLLAYDDAIVRLYTEYNEGVVVSQKVDISFDMTICGVFESYSDRWDTGIYSAANAYVYDGTGDYVAAALTVIEDKLLKRMEYERSYDVYVRSSDALTAYDKLKGAYLAGDAGSQGTIGGTSALDWVEIEHLSEKYYIRNKDFNPSQYTECAFFPAASAYAVIDSAKELLLSHEFTCEFMSSFCGAVEYSNDYPHNLFADKYYIESASLRMMNGITGGTLIPWDVVSEALNANYGNAGEVDFLLANGSGSFTFAPQEGMSLTDVLTLYDPANASAADWVEVRHGNGVYYMESRYMPDVSGYSDSTFYYVPCTDETLARAVRTGNDGVTRSFLHLVSDSSKYSTGELVFPDAQSVVDEGVHYPYVENTLPLRINRLAYPDGSADAKAAMMLSVIGVIFATTVCSVFQIFLTQVKRRSRKLALMKSVGADNAQVASLLLCEGLIVLIIALPAGAALGGLLSYGAVALANALRDGAPIVFQIDPVSTGIGLAASVLGLFVGMLAPLIIAVRTPLRGSVSVSAGKVSHAKRAAKSEMGAQSFASVNRRHERANRRRMNLASALCCFVLTIMLIAVFLGYEAFGDYRDMVVNVDRPDYMIKLPYALGAAALDTVTEELRAIEGVEFDKLYGFRMAESAWLYSDKLLYTDNGSLSDLINQFYALLPPEAVHQYISGAAQDEGADEDDVQIVETTPAYEIAVPNSALTSTGPHSCRHSDADTWLSFFDLQVQLSLLDAFPLLFSRQGTSGQISAYARAYYDEEYGAFRFIRYTPELGEERGGELSVYCRSGAVPFSLADHVAEDSLLIAPAGSYATTVYGMNPSSSAYQLLMDAITTGELDAEAFQRGEQVILLAPMQKAGSGSGTATTGDLAALDFSRRASALLNATGRYDLTLLASHAPLYDVDDALEVGDRLWLYGRDTRVSEAGLFISVTEIETTVGAIIRYFPDEPIWPFSDSEQPYAIIASSSVVTGIYPQHISRPSRTLSTSLAIMDRLFYKGSMGGTEIYLYSQDATRGDTDLPLLSYCWDNGFTLYNYRESGASLYQASVNSSIITGLLGAAAALIAFVILRSTIVSAIEQESKRYGILQSIGVRGAQFKTYQGMLGLRQGILGVLVANAAVALVLFASVLVERAGMGFTLSELLYAAFVISMDGYPWALHAGICAAFVVVMTLLYRLPIDMVLRRSPVENIRS